MFQRRCTTKTILGNGKSLYLYFFSILHKKIRKFGEISLSFISNEQLFNLKFGFKDQRKTLV